MRRWLRRSVGAGAAVLAGMQLVPYGWSHPNPPASSAPPWPSSTAETLARAACYDCHSNETDWPVYSYVAPVSWLVRRDVDDGRHELNLSDWDDDSGEADDAAEAIAEGSMPPRRYALLHRDARLSDAEEQLLIDAFLAMDDDD